MICLTQFVTRIHARFQSELVTEVTLHEIDWFLFFENSHLSTVSSNENLKIADDPEVGERWKQVKFGDSWLLLTLNFLIGV